MRIVMYSPDSIGLGHMRRNATIAAELVRQKPGASVALLIGSGAGAFFSVPKGVDTIKLPSVQKVAAETWQSRSLNLSVDETTSIRAGIIQKTVASLKPDALLVDHLPMGVCRDLLPTLTMIKQQRLATSVVLGLRDILDDPALITQRWAAQGQYQFIESYYDAVMIYGDRDIYPSGKLYGLEDCLPGGVTYAGFVCDAPRASRDSRGDADAIRALAGLETWASGDKVIVVSGGGGNDAFPMCTAALDVLTRLDETEPIRAVIIAGPLMPEADRNRLQALTKRLKRTRLVAWTADCMDYLSVADVAVVMAGYNSSLEALSTTARVIMLPRPGPSSEQKIRARMLHQRSLVDCIEAHEVTSERVEVSLRQALAAHPRNSCMTMLDGAANAARTLINLALVPAARARQPVDVPRSRYVVF